MADREDLINQLAASMGAGDFAATRYEESRFDPETGTLYCDGIMVSKSAIDEALAFYRQMYAKCKYNTDNASQKMAITYKIAIEAITKMQQQKDAKKDA